MVGIANTDNRLITMSRAFGARDSQIFMKVSLPVRYRTRRRHARRVGPRWCICRRREGGAATGLGYLSSVAAQRFQMAAMFVPIIIIAGLGAGLNETLKAIEHRLDKWKPQKS
jgi:NitT/TauT family transport system permease protein